MSTMIKTILSHNKFYISKNIPKEIASSVLNLLKNTICFSLDVPSLYNLKPDPIVPILPYNNMYIEFSTPTAHQSPVGFLVIGDKDRTDFKVFCFMVYENKPPRIPQLLGYLHVKDKTNSNSEVLWGLPGIVDKTVQDSLVCKFLSLFMYFQNIIQCKNIQIIDDNNHRTFVKENHKRGHKICFKTLTISSVIKRRKQNVHGVYMSDSPTTKPFFLVRGHIKRYVNKSLFGKVFGNFFFPAHAVGDLKNGCVVKKYRVKSIEEGL